MSRLDEDGLACPGCGSTSLYVKDTTNAGGYIRRRRQCKTCGNKATTYEVIDRKGDPAGVRVGDMLQLREHLLKLAPDTRVLVRRLIVKLAEGGIEAPPKPAVTESESTQERVPDDIPEEMPT